MKLHEHIAGVMDGAHGWCDAWVGGYGLEAETPEEVEMLRGLATQQARLVEFESGTTVLTLSLPNHVRSKIDRRKIMQDMARPQEGRE